MIPLRCLYSRCRSCQALMYIDEAEVVYCECEGFEIPKGAEIPKGGESDD